MELYAPCGFGLESILGQELKDLGMHEVRPLTGGVSFTADLRETYTALLWSRVASRILLVLGRIDAQDSDALYSGAFEIPWEDCIAPHASIAVYARGTSDELRDTRFTALRIKDAVCDRMREKTGERPDVDAQNPDLRIQVNLHKKRATIYIDLSGASLEDRGYATQVRSTSTPVHETLAAAVLIAAQWPERAREGHGLVDTMSAAGTIAIEAALIAGDVAPRLLRSQWGFFGWAGNDEALWHEVLDEADERAQNCERAVSVFASDSREDSRSCTRARAKAAGIASIIEVCDDEAALWKAVEKRKIQDALFVSSLFVSADAPEATLPARYAQLACDFLAHDELKQAAMLVGGVDADAYLGRQRVEGFACMNGSSPCEIALFDLKTDGDLNASVNVRDRTIAAYDANAQQFADRLQKMMKQRRKWAQQENIFAYRVYDADLPDYNMAIDLYIGAGKSEGRQLVHVAEYAPPKSIDPMKAARRMADALNITCAVFELAPSDVFVKRRIRARGGSQYVDAGSKKARGDASNASGRLVTMENGLLFEVDLASYLDTGLFLDHRDTRKLVGTLASGKSFLNLFAYTCTASVYAAANKAKFTTSVDLSNTYLQWGERNMKLNGLMSTHQEFERADCIAWVREMRRSRNRWDLIFVDPPTFSNSSKMGSHSWDVQKDHAELLIGVSRLLTRGGAAVFSCNLRGFKLDAEPLKKAGIQIVDITDKTIPVDFERHRNIHHCFVLRRI